MRIAPLASLLVAVAAGAAAQTLSVMPTGGLRGETAALLLSGQEGGPLPLAVLALPGRSEHS